MITYGDIYEAARKERYSEQLQKIPSKFVLDFTKYLKEKKDLISKEIDSFSNIAVGIKKQLENAQTIFNELILRRRRKILSLSLIASETGRSKQDIANMLDFEKDFFDGLINCIKCSDNKLQELLNETTQRDSEKKLILFKENVNQFMGLNGEDLGPYEKGQIANLSREIAMILISENKAEFVIEES